MIESEYINCIHSQHTPIDVQKVSKETMYDRSSVAKFSLLPIGQLSEVLEARNKDVRHFQLNHTRKFYRTITNRDLYQRLLFTSDPVICSTYYYKLKKNNLTEEIKKLILEESNNSEHSSDTDDDNH